MEYCSIIVMGNLCLAQQGGRCDSAIIEDGRTMEKICRMISKEVTCRIKLYYLHAIKHLSFSIGAQEW